MAGSVDPGMGEGPRKKRKKKPQLGPNGKPLGRKKKKRKQAGSLAAPLLAAFGAAKLNPAEFAAKFRTKKEKKTDDLRGTLMLGFAVLAILPMLVAVVLMTRIAEQGIVVSTDELARISKDALSETSGKIGELSKQQIDSTGEQLTDIGSKAVRDTAQALITTSEKRFQEANQQLIEQGEESNKALSEQLVAESKDATRELARSLIRVSEESNRELSRATAKQAEQTIVQLADRLVEQANKNTSAISTYIVAQNKESAKHLSERMLKDVEREPVVNFKTLASIFAQGIATNKVAPIRDGYLAVVDPRGRVLASTKYKKGTSVRHLEIIQLALGRETSEDSLIRFKDGSDQYLGVFARRDDGGAVVFAYLADRARVDTDRMKDDVQNTLNQMGSDSSRYVIQSMEAARPLMRAQATKLSKQSIGKIQATSAALSAKTSKRMQTQADTVSSRAVESMTERAEAAAAETAEAIKKRSEEIATHALAAMRPIGKEYAAKAEAAMRAEAEKAVMETAEIVPQAAEAASAKATARMAPEARRLADSAKQQMWLVAGILLVLEIILAIVASLLMSGRIAAPIITEQQKAREEKERLSREMEIASKIQTCLLPPVPELQDFDVAVSMVPAEEVGGDFVDLLPDAEPGAFWMGIGDVTGHGLTPGLIMMMAQSVFNSLARTPDMTPKDLYDGMNRVLYQNIKDRLKTSDHMTMSILKHEADGTFVHCGSHLDILVYRAETREVERLVTDGPWVGMLPECEDFTTEIRFELGESDVLLLYTDGLIEVQNAQQEQWDMDRLCDSLARHAHLGAREIQSKVLADSLNWANKILDDISMIVVKRSAIELTSSVPQADVQPVGV